MEFKLQVDLILDALSSLLDMWLQVPGVRANPLGKNELLFEGQTIRLSLLEAIEVVNVGLKIDFVLYGIKSFI